MHHWCGRGWGEPLQTLVTGHLVSRVNGQHAEEELSITGGLGSGRLTDIKMVLGVFLPIFLNTGHGRIQGTGSHPWTVHRYRVVYLKCSGFCVDMEGWILSQSYNFVTFTVSS